MFKTSFVFLLSAFVTLGQRNIAPQKEAAMKADLAGQIDGMKMNWDLIRRCCDWAGKIIIIYNRPL